MDLFDLVEECEAGDVGIMLDLVYELGFTPTDEYSSKIQGLCLMHPKLPELVLVVCPGVGGWYYLHRDKQHGPRGEYSEYYSHKRDDILADFMNTPIKNLFRSDKIESLLSNV